MASETSDLSSRDGDDDAVRWLSESEQLAWRGWIDASRRVLAATDRQLKRDAGLTTDDYEVFVRLSEADQHRLRMSELANSVTNSPSRLSQRIDRLSRDGYVERVRCVEDARVWWVELTDTGREKLEATAPGHVGAVREAFVDRLTADEDHDVESNRTLVVEDVAADVRPVGAGGA